MLSAIAAMLLAGQSAPASIDDAAWLAGRWVGEGLGGQVEEVWSPPQGGQMVGHFSLAKNGAIVFYEIELIDVQANGLRMRVKHFNPDFTGWEEKGAWHSFEPVGADAQELRFTGLTLRHEGDTMRISILIRERGATAPVERILTLRRVP